MKHDELFIRQVDAATENYADDSPPLSLSMSLCLSVFLFFVRVGMSVCGKTSLLICGQGWQVRQRVLRARRAAEIKSLGANNKRRASGKCHELCRISLNTHATHRRLLHAADDRFDFYSHTAGLRLTRETELPSNRLALFSLYDL